MCNKWLSRGQQVTECPLQEMQLPLAMLNVGFILEPRDPEFGPVHSLFQSCTTEFEEFEWKPWNRALVQSTQRVELFWLCYIFEDFTAEF